MLLLNMSLDCYNDPFYIITVKVIGEIRFISVRGRKCANSRKQIRQIQDFTGVYGEKRADSV